MRYIWKLIFIYNNLEKRIQKFVSVISDYINENTRNILLDLTKIIIKRNITDFYLEVLVLSIMQKQVILAMVLEKK